ncbi:carbamoyltransferase C-terminal domain-containing protein [Chelatococcus sp. GCM10030263]|uniref:carbamoyltransferase C-terminal domain-containing protein n=1 Tax=Chelatococcus sp. GCM10030263 TaxID=3273387 RepID=UPI00362083F3
MRGRRIALGINCAHDASATLCDGGGILASIAEERLNRIKHYCGFPSLAVRAVLDYCGLTIDDVDIVAFSSQFGVLPQHEDSLVVGLDARARVPSAENMAFQPDAADPVGSVERRLGEIWAGFGERHPYARVEEMAELGFFRRHLRHYHVHHHLSHAASAFLLSGLEDACVLTVDGKGDKASATIYRGTPGGALTMLRSSASRDSLGCFYQAVTEALGFVPIDSEYKTMGLAALDAQGEGPNAFDGVVSCRDGVFSAADKWQFRCYNRANPQRRLPNPMNSVVQSLAYGELLQRMTPVVVAGEAQRHFEDNMLAFVRDAMAISGCRSLAAAGGGFLNVKANRRILDTLRPDHFFVFPDAADSGNAAGAALMALQLEGALESPLRLPMPYFGNDFTADRVEHLLMQSSDIEVSPAGPEDIAQALTRGEVIGTFQGRMEAGPRALGNRSVLADPRHASVKDRINGLLKGRDPFVPFAPIVMEEEASRHWAGPTDYRYMTFAVEASQYARETVPAVVHVDGSMRPQVMGERDNPLLHALLGAFRGLTGVGVVLNTSFNRHGLPIVGSPEDALDHLRQGWVDSLWIGPWRVVRGGGATPG